MRRGFSLVELLAVMAVIAVMMSLLLPSITGFGGTTARKGAVNTVMGTLEQARVAALESGRNVMVVFARPNVPERDALMVLREPEDPTENYEALTRWIRLPEKVLLHDPGAGGSLFAVPPPADLESRLPVPKPPGTVKDLSVITFNSSGAVEFPSGSQPSNLRVVISEGVRGENGQEALTVTGFDIVSASRFTGRVQLDVSFDQ
jgi:prepilin-type N-terminal cleavage/methylation domain-containing protein